MSMEQNTLIISDGIYYPNVLKDIKKSKQHFQPIFEIFTNALESIKLKQSVTDNGSITISIFSRQSMNADEYKLHEIVIEDSGIGFDTENFGRMTRFKDNRKGFFNNGSGRIQILHSFDTAKYFSVFKEGDAFKQRSFTLSQHHLSKNAIISDHKLEETQDSLTKTVVTLHGVLNENDEHTYNKLTADGLKKALIARYMMEFCNNSEKMPIISITHYLDGDVLEKQSITKEDIPLRDSERDLEVHYYRLSIDGKEFEKSNRSELLKLTAFKIPAHDLKRNDLKFTSKGEIIPDSGLELKSLAAHDRLEGCRYLFMISGGYIDDRDGDTRGTINIQRREQYKQANASHMNLYGDEQIFLDDIESEANSTITHIYPLIRAKKDEKLKDIDKLKNMFLLNDETLRKLSFSLDEPEEKILEKVYAADSKAIAKKDAEIKKNIESLESLDTTASNYQEDLAKLTSDLTRAIPLQNRVALTHYVARRKLVLELFGKILARQLNVQKAGGRNIDEKLFHNLIFQQSQQSSGTADESDLWLINEDFIYFKGTSESRLCDVEIEGEKIFKSEFSEEEDRYIKSFGENRITKKPDVLLFPDEGKCIVIEFKNTNVNVATYLNQITFYSTLIRNFTKDKYQIDTFYGYLIGEEIEPRDVRAYDGDFVVAYQFDYLFRPKKAIVGENGRRDGTLYTEVIKYSTLLDRARRRNDIFIKKLTEKRKSS